MITKQKTMALIVIKNAFDNILGALSASGVTS